MLVDHELVVNTDKTKVLIFNKKDNSVIPNAGFQLGTQWLQIEKEYKYLGVILNTTLSETSEMQRILKSFNNTSGKFFRQFYSANFHIKDKLFDLLCMSFYGLNLIEHRSPNIIVLIKMQCHSIVQ